MQPSMVDGILPLGTQQSRFGIFGTGCCYCRKQRCCESKRCTRCRPLTNSIGVVSCRLLKSACQEWVARIVDRPIVLLPKQL